MTDAFCKATDGTSLHFVGEDNCAILTVSDMARATHVQQPFKRWHLKMFGFPQSECLLHGLLHPGRIETQLLSTK